MRHLMRAWLVTLAVATVACSAPIAQPTARPEPRPLTSAEIAAIGRLGVVFLEETASGAYELTLGTRKSGSGAYLGDGYVLTAAHVVGTARVRTARSISVRFNNARVGVAEIVAFDPDADLALLHADGFANSGAKALRWGDTAALALGEQLVVIGYPEPGLTVTRGIVSGLKQRGAVALVQTDAALNPGNSGGPVLDESGHLVGIVSFKFRESEGLSFAVASSTAFPFFEFMTRTRTLTQALTDRGDAVQRMNGWIAGWDRRSPDVLDDVAELSLRAAVLVARSTADANVEWYREGISALDRRYAALVQRRAGLLRLKPFISARQLAADEAALDRDFEERAREFDALQARYSSQR